MFLHQQIKRNFTGPGLSSSLALLLAGRETPESRGNNKKIKCPLLLLLLFFSSGLAFFFSDPMFKST
jgi:hypothetical protein